MKKKILILLGLTSFIVGCSGTNTSETNSNSVNDNSISESYDIEGYELYWHDEFDGDTLNEEYWNYMYGDGSIYGNPGWGNQEAQYYKEENVSLRDGNLIITAKREDCNGKKYTSARINTTNKVAVKYGRIEASISLPEVEGMWPAFWMLPESDTPYGNWPSSGEIDIMEARGRINNFTSSALHYGALTSPSTYQTKTHVLRDDTISSYHVYALEWSMYTMNWYVDDDLFFTIDNSEGVRGQKWFSMADPDSLTAPFDYEFHILLNMAVGGHFDNFVEPPETFDYAEMKVDYVRIYKEV